METALLIAQKNVQKIVQQTMVLEFVVEDALEDARFNAPDLVQHFAQLSYSNKNEHEKN